MEHGINGVRRPFCGRIASRCICWRELGVELVVDARVRFGSTPGR